MKFSKQLFIGFLFVVSIFFTADTALADNSAPVLDASRIPVLSAVLEDAGAPTGIVGTQVLSLADFTMPVGGLDNVSDSDAGPSLGIAITAVDSSLTCYYTLNSGASWLVIGSVSDSSARLLAANVTNRIYCAGSSDLNGSTASAITFRAWDQTSGTDGSIADTTSSGGTTAFSTATDTASLMIIAVNDAPEATNLNTAESYMLNIARNLTNIVVSDVDSSNVTATLTLSAPSAGTLSTATSGAVTSTYNAGTGVWAATGAIANVNILLAGVTYTPATGYTSNFTIATSVTDGIAAAVTGSKNITYVTNSAPVAVDDAYTIDEDTATLLSVVTNDTDVDSDALIVSAVTTPNHGDAIVISGGAGVSYTPDADFNGIDIFDYTVSDGNGGTDTGSVTVTVAPINDAPIPVDDEFTIAENSAETIFNLISNDYDVDGDLLTISSFPSGISHGVGGLGTGDITYTPDTDYCGDDVGTYLLLDSNGGSTTGNITIHITCADTTPPETFITSSTVSSISSSTATFIFESNDESATFQCGIDTGSGPFYTSCTSPFSSPMFLSGNTYTFWVRAKDAADNIDATPAHVTWSVSNVVVSSVSPANAATEVSTTTPIVYTFTSPVSDELKDGIVIGSGPCNDTCPHLNGVWSNGDTVLTYTNADGAFAADTTYTVNLSLNNGITTGDLYENTFTTARERSTSSSGRRTTIEPIKPQPQVTTEITQSNNLNKVTRILKLGMIGADVKWLQEYLNAHNFSVTEIGKETNYFGPKTKKAVQAFQKAHGLKADGVVGSKTRLLLL